MSRPSGSDTLLLPFDDFAARYRSPWTELWEATGSPPDLSPEWAECLLASRSAKRGHCRVAAWFEDGQLAGVWPVLIERERRQGLAVTVVRPLLGLFCLHQALLSRNAPAAAVERALAALNGGTSGWSVLEIDRLVENEAWFDAWCKLARQRGFATETGAGLAPPFLQIDGDWEQFLASKSANFRSNLKRKPRRLEAAGEVVCTFVATAGDMEPALAAITEIEQRSWKGTAGTAITSREWEQAFYHRLVHTFAPVGGVLITLLYLNQRPIAFDLSVMAASRAYCLKTSFDGEYGELAPGFALRAQLMRRMFDLGMKEYDFLGANERYKLEWSATTRVERSLVLFNHGWRAALLRRLRVLSSRLRPPQEARVATGET
jgi:CelD/BcsL family acetyltransferase involved in cellulose biosynthesis